MGKLAALTTLLTIAFLVYFFTPSQVQVANTTIESEQSRIEVKEKTKQIKPLTIQQVNKDSPEHSHPHNTSADENDHIPQYIKDQLESKRIPASELTVQKHPDGSSSIDLKGQFQHVPVAILGEDGKVKIVETRIEPKTD